MYLAGYVPVERKSKTSIKALYDKCKGCVKDGWSLVLFPQVGQSKMVVRDKVHTPEGASPIKTQRADIKNRG